MSVLRAVYLKVLKSAKIDRNSFWEPQGTLELFKSYPELETEQRSIFNKLRQANFYLNALLMLNDGTVFEILQGL